MKTLIALVMTAFLSLTVASSFALAYFRGRPNQMAGQDWATRGYNAAAKEKKTKGLSCSSASAACIRNNGSSPEVVAKCQSATSKLYQYRHVCWGAGQSISGLGEDVTVAG